MGNHQFKFVQVRQCIPQPRNRESRGDNDYISLRCKNGDVDFRCSCFDKAESYNQRAVLLVVVSGAMDGGQGGRSGRLGESAGIREVDSLYAHPFRTRLSGECPKACSCVFTIVSVSKTRWSLGLGPGT